MPLTGSVSENISELTHHGKKKRTRKQIIAIAINAAKRKKKETRPGEPVRLSRLDPFFIDALAHAGEDDGPWLAFADHLDEHGYPHMADAVRRSKLSDHHNDMRIGESTNSYGYLMADAGLNWMKQNRVFVSMRVPLRDAQIENPDATHLVIFSGRQSESAPNQEQPYLNRVADLTPWQRYGFAREFAKLLNEHDQPERASNVLTNHGHVDDEIDPGRLSRGTPVRLAVHPDADGLLRAAGANPDDPAASLALADFLEEQGDPRHLVIRHQGNLTPHRGASVQNVLLRDRYSTGNGDFHEFAGYAKLPGRVHVAWWPPVKGEILVDRHPQWTAELPAADALDIAHYAAKACGFEEFPSDSFRWLEDMAMRFPQRMARPGRPVRLAHSDIDPLFRAVRANPHDDAPWLVLADALEEIGKPHTAQLMRDFASNGVRAGGNGRLDPSRRIDPDDVNFPSRPRRIGGGVGHVAGIPFHIKIYGNQHAYVQLNHNHRLLVPNRSDDYAPGTAMIRPAHAIGILTEFDPPHDSPEQRMARSLADLPRGPEHVGKHISARLDAEPKPPSKRRRRKLVLDALKAAKLRRDGRPVRLSMETISSLHEAATHDPHDHAKWAALADALDEEGKPHTAAALRNLFERGRPGTSHYYEGQEVPVIADESRSLGPYHNGLFGFIAGMPVMLTRHSYGWMFGVQPTPQASTIAWSAIDNPHGERILHEIDAPDPMFASTLHEMKRAHPLRPEQMSRGTPVRLARVDQGIINAAVHAEPGDDAPWLVLADHLDEVGLPHVAHVARHGGGREHILDSPHRYASGFFTDLTGWKDTALARGNEAYGHVYGWPGQPLFTPGAAAMLRLWSGSKRSDRILHTEDPGFIHRMADELQDYVAANGPEQPNWADLEKFGSRRRMARPGRPVRLAIDESFVRSLIESGEDHAPWLVFADHLDEQGYPYIADAIRRSRPGTSLVASGDLTDRGWGYVLGKWDNMNNDRVQADIHRRIDKNGFQVLLTARSARHMSHKGRGLSIRHADIDHDQARGFATELRQLMSERGDEGMLGEMKQLDRFATDLKPPERPTRMARGDVFLGGSARDRLKAALRRHKGLPPIEETPYGDPENNPHMTQPEEAPYAPPAGLGEVHQPVADVMEQVRRAAASQAVEPPAMPTPSTLPQPTRRPAQPPPLPTPESRLAAAVEHARSFRPTTLAPSPGHQISGRESYLAGLPSPESGQLADAAAVLAGTKPAAILHRFFTDSALGQHVLGQLRQQGQVARIVPHPQLSELDSVLIGPADRVAALDAAHRSTHPFRSVHIGRLLGYPEESIRRYMTGQPHISGMRSRPGIRPDWHWPEPELGVSSFGGPVVHMPRDRARPMPASPETPAAQEPIPLTPISGPGGVGRTPAQLHPPDAPTLPQPHITPEHYHAAAIESYYARRQAEERARREWAAARGLGGRLPEHFSRRERLKAAIRGVRGDRLAGGRADRVSPSSFSPRAVATGAKVEREHTSDPGLAAEIARDHLVEDQNYYRKLAAAKLARGTPIRLSHLDEVVSLLRSIRLEPHEHGAHLALADALEAMGRPEHAAVIREAVGHGGIGRFLPLRSYERHLTETPARPGYYAVPKWMADNPGEFLLDPSNRHRLYTGVPAERISRGRPSKTNPAGHLSWFPGGALTTTEHAERTQRLRDEGARMMIGGHDCLLYDWPAKGDVTNLTKLMRDRFPVRFGREEVEGLIEASRVNPYDHGPKLVLADALEENGHSGAADIIRRGLGHFKTKRAMKNPLGSLSHRAVRVASGRLHAWLYPSDTIEASDDVRKLVPSTKSTGRLRLPTWRGLGVRLLDGEYNLPIVQHYTHDGELIRRLLSEFGPPKWGDIRGYRRMLHWLQPVIGGAGDLDPGPYGRMPERMSRPDFAALAAQALSAVKDEAPPLVLADALSDAGMSEHGDLIRQNVAHDPWPTSFNRDEVGRWMHEDDTGGDLVRFLLLHPGRTIVRAGGGHIYLFMSVPPPRTKAGTIPKRAYAPQLAAWSHGPFEPEELDRRYQALLAEGAIGLRRGHVENWPERGIHEPRRMSMRDRFKRAVRLSRGLPVRLALQDMHGWLTPQGEFHPVTGAVHDRWLRENMRMDPEDAMRQGWHRITFQGRTVHTDNPYVPPTGRQRSYLINQALENQMGEVIHDARRGNDRPLWSEHEQMARAGSPVRLSQPGDQFTAHIGDLILRRDDLESAIGNIHRGCPSMTEGPLEVVYVPGEDRHELVNGYHRLVQGVGEGEEDFPVRVSSIHENAAPESVRFTYDPYQTYLGLEDLPNGWLLNRMFGRRRLSMRSRLKRSIRLRRGLSIHMAAPTPSLPTPAIFELLRTPQQPLSDIGPRHAGQVNVRGSGRMPYQLTITKQIEGPYRVAFHDLSTDRPMGQWDVGEDHARRIWQEFRPHVGSVPHRERVEDMDRFAHEFDHQELLRRLNVRDVGEDQPKPWHHPEAMGGIQDMTKTNPAIRPPVTDEDRSWDKLARPGEPLRLVRDSAPLLAAAEKDLHDPAPWLVLADHAEEQGKPAAADLFRRIASPDHHVTNRDWDWTNERVTSDTPGLTWSHVRQRQMRGLGGFHLGDPAQMILYALPSSESADGRPSAAAIHVYGPSLHSGNLARRQLAVHVTSDMDFLKRLLGEGESEPSLGNWVDPPAALAARLTRRDRVKQAIKLAAQRDRGIDPAMAQDRALSGNHQDLIQTLRTTLDRAGLRPNRVWPAVHDYKGQARAAAVAEVLRELRPGAAEYGAAWQGLIGRMPGMVVFRSHPQGPDSVYRFAFKGPVEAMSQILDKTGVANRVFVPHGLGTHVYLYDEGRKLRPAIADLVTRLRLDAIEHTGQGNPIGGGDDMGRSDYRQQVRQFEGQGQSQQMSRRPARLRDRVKAAICMSRGLPVRLANVLSLRELHPFTEAIAAVEPGLFLGWNEPADDYAATMGVLADHMEAAGDPRAFLVRRHYDRLMKNIAAGKWNDYFGSMTWDDTQPDIGRYLTSRELVLPDSQKYQYTIYTKPGRGRYANRTGPMAARWSVPVGHDRPYGPYDLGFEARVGPQTFREMIRQTIPEHERRFLDEAGREWERPFSSYYADLNPPAAEPEQMSLRSRLKQAIRLRRGLPVKMAFGRHFSNPFDVPSRYPAMLEWFEANKGRRGAWPTNAKVGNNRFMTKTPEGDLKIYLHRTPVVTAHPDGTYTLDSGGWHTPLTAGTMEYFAPGRVTFWHPDFFDGARVNQDGEFLHTISGPYNEQLRQLMEEVHGSRQAPGWPHLSRSDSRVALDGLIHALKPYWDQRRQLLADYEATPKTRPDEWDNTYRPRADDVPNLPDQEYDLDPYDPDAIHTSHALNMAEYMDAADKPHTAHALRLLHHETGPMVIPPEHAAGEQIEGTVAHKWVGIRVPRKMGDEFGNPNWLVSFSPEQENNEPVDEYEPVLVDRPPVMQHQSVLVPPHIGRGILHEIDRTDPTLDPLQESNQARSLAAARKRHPVPQPPYRMSMRDRVRSAIRLSRGLPVKLAWWGRRSYGGFSNGYGGGTNHVPAHPTYEQLHEWYDAHVRAFEHRAPHAIAGHNRTVWKDPHTGDLIFYLYNTPLVTFHTDGTRTLSVGRYGDSPMTRDTLDWVAPRFDKYYGASRAPWFFNGVRVTDDGRPVHELMPTHKEGHPTPPWPDMSKHTRMLMEEAEKQREPHWRPGGIGVNENDPYSDRYYDGGAARVALDYLIERHRGSLRKPHGTYTQWIPHLDFGQITPLWKMLAAAADHYDPDHFEEGYDGELLGEHANAMYELAEQYELGDKPYTAHVMRQIARQPGPNVDRRHWHMGHTASGYMGRPGSWHEDAHPLVVLESPAKRPGEDVPRPALWRITFTNHRGDFGLSTEVPMEIGKGVLHEIDYPRLGGKAELTELKSMRAKFDNPGLYRFARSAGPNPLPEEHYDPWIKAQVRKNLEAKFGRVPDRAGMAAIEKAPVTRIAYNHAGSYEKATELLHNMAMPDHPVYAKYDPAKHGNFANRFFGYMRSAVHFDPTTVMPRQYGGREVPASAAPAPEGSDFNILESGLPTPAQADPPARLPRYTDKSAERRAAVRANPDTHPDRIHRVVASEPGITWSRLTARSELTTELARTAVDQLVKAGKVKEVRVPGDPKSSGGLKRLTTRLYPAGHEVPATPPATIDQVVEHVKAGLPAKDIADKLGLHRTAISYFIQQAKKKGLIPPGFQAVKAPSGYPSKIDQAALQKMLAQGMSMAAISRQIGMSHNAVRGAVKRARAAGKLSRREAIKDAIRLHRGAPVRLNLDRGLVAGIASAPQEDEAPWLVLADHLDEHGYPAFAHAIRHGERLEHRQALDRMLDLAPGHRAYDQPKVGEYSMWGTEANDPMLFHYLRFDPGSRQGWLWLSAMRRGRSNIGTLIPRGETNRHLWLTDPHHIRDLAEELKRSAIESAGALPTGLHDYDDLIQAIDAVVPRQMERDGSPVRLAVDHGRIDSLANSDPDDDGPWLAFADHLEEEGYPGMAHAIRHGEKLDREDAWRRAAPTGRPNVMGFAHGRPYSGQKGVWHELHFSPVTGRSLWIADAVSGWATNRRYIWLTDPALARQVVEEMRAGRPGPHEPGLPDERGPDFDHVLSVIDRYLASRPPERMARPLKGPWNMTPEEVADIKARDPSGNKYFGNDEEYHGDAPREDWLKPSHFRGTTPPPRSQGGRNDIDTGWVAVRSSWIGGIRRFKGSNAVDFMVKKGGRVYRYRNAPKGLFWRWLAATSKGRFFWAAIRGYLSPAQKLAMCEAVREAVRLARGDRQ